MAALCRLPFHVDADGSTSPPFPGQVVILANGGVTDTSHHGHDNNHPIFGGDGHDVIHGSNFNGRFDIICGNGGNDAIAAHDGADWLSGGPGVDNLLGENGNDTVSGGPGEDTLQGGNNDDILTGGPGSDHFKAGSGIDQCNGSSGADDHQHDANCTTTTNFP